MFINTHLWTQKSRFTVFFLLYFFYFLHKHKSKVKQTANHKVKGFKSIQKKRATMEGKSFLFLCQLNIFTQPYYFRSTSRELSWLASVFIDSRSFGRQQMMNFLTNFGIDENDWCDKKIYRIPVVRSGSIVCKSMAFNIELGIIQ